MNGAKNEKKTEVNRISHADKTNHVNSVAEDEEKKNKKKIVSH